MQSTDPFADALNALGVSNRQTFNCNYNILKEKNWFLLSCLYLDEQHATTKRRVSPGEFLFPVQTENWLFNSSSIRFVEHTHACVLVFGRFK